MKQKKSPQQKIADFLQTQKTTDNELFVCENCGGIPLNQQPYAKCIRCGSNRVKLTSIKESLQERYHLYLEIYSYVGDDREKLIKSFGYDGIMFHGNIDIAQGRHLPTTLRWVKKGRAINRIVDNELINLYYDAKNGLPISRNDMVEAIRLGLVDFNYTKTSYTRNPNLKKGKEQFLSDERTIKRNVRKFANLIVKIWEGEVDINDYEKEFDLSLELDCRDEINSLIDAHGIDIKKVPKLYNYFKQKLEKDMENTIITEPYST